MKIRYVALWIAVLCSISGTAGFFFFYLPESSFELAPESRLPRWITLPPGYARADVSVTLNIYSIPGLDARFILKDRQGKKLAGFHGKLTTSDPSPYTGVVSVNGRTEAIALKPYSEHENMVLNGIIVALFYVLDDSCARDELSRGGLPMCQRKEMNLNSEGCPCLIDPDNLAAAASGKLP